MKIDDNEILFLQGWLKKKPAMNFGGNFWGPNRNRCSIMKPNHIAALENGGWISRTGNSFMLTPKAWEVKRK